MSTQAREADPRPIYVQVAEDLKSLILSGEFAAENRAPSTKELSEFYQVSPTTTAKTMTELSMAGLVEKERGFDVFVTPGTRERIQVECREAFQCTYIEPLKAEAGILGLMFDNVVAMLEEEK